MMKQMNLMNKHRYKIHQQPPFSNGTLANINSILNMGTIIYQNYRQMKVKHTLLHSKLAYQHLWMIKSTMPFQRHSLHHLTVCHNLTSYQMMTMIKLTKYSGTHLHIFVRTNSPINVFVSVNEQHLPNLFCTKLLKLSSS
jgi:hypothetical protein